MKLVGYLKNDKELSFQTPVYGKREGGFFFHTVDDRYNILHFQVADIKQADFKKIYFSKKFSIGSKAPLIFMGREEYLHFHTAPNAIEEVIAYLNDHSTDGKVNAILDEAMLIKNRVFSDHFVVDNFVVKMQPKEEQITLTFDFPSPNGQYSSTDQVVESPHETKPDSRKSLVQLDHENNPHFTKAIQYLNSVDMNFELTLKLRAEERKNKLKMFNYQFKLNQNKPKNKSESD